MKAVEDGLKQILADGSQQDLLNNMQTRAQLYALLQYERYNEFDTSIYNFELKKD